MERLDFEALQKINEDLAALAKSSQDARRG